MRGALIVGSAEYNPSSKDAKNVIKINLKPIVCLKQKSP